MRIVYWNVLLIVRFSGCAGYSIECRKFAGGNVYYVLPLTVLKMQAKVLVLTLIHRE